MRDLLVTLCSTNLWLVQPLSQRIHRDGLAVLLPLLVEGIFQQNKTRIQTKTQTLLLVLLLLLLHHPVTARPQQNRMHFLPLANEDFQEILPKSLERLIFCPRPNSNVFFFSKVLFLWPAYPQDNNKNKLAAGCAESACFVALLPGSIFFVFPLRTKFPPFFTLSIHL